MHTLESPENGLKLEFPSKVAELNTTQFIRFCKDFCELQQGRMNEDDFMVSLVYNCLEMRPLRNRRSSEDERSAMVIALEQLSSTLMSFWNIPEGSTEAVIDWFFADQKIPAIEHMGRTMHGPAEHLADLTYGEYAKAHTYYSVYLREEREELLDKLIAVLYRPTVASLMQRFKGSKTERLPLKGYDLAEAERWAARLPYHVKYAVFVWWNNMEEFIRIAEIDTDAGKVNLGLLFEHDPDSKTNVENNTGIRGVLYHLAESAVFGSMEQTESTNFWEVMLRLYQLRQNAQADRERIQQFTKKGGQS